MKLSCLRILIGIFVSFVPHQRKVSEVHSEKVQSLKSIVFAHFNERLTLRISIA